MKCRLDDATTGELRLGPFFSFILRIGALLVLIRSLTPSSWAIGMPPMTVAWCRILRHSCLKMCDIVVSFCGPVLFYARDVPASKLVRRTSC